MARILPYYSLCPLIEQKSFLGLVEDINDDIALITVNANIISRYKISEPKLLSSWNSKGSITSACIYDPSKERYIAIFNHNEIRIWTAADESIDKIKKYKFTEKLYKLLYFPENGKVILVYNSGYVFDLDSVLENRKKAFEKQLIAKEAKILSCDKYGPKTDTVIFVIEKSNSEYQILCSSPNQEEPIFNLCVRNKDNVALVGHCLLVDKNCEIVTLWSNGKLYRDMVSENMNAVAKNYITTLSDVDLSQTVTMKMLSPYYIAICGSKSDGVLLMIYSMKYNLIPCQQYYENCRALRQMWNFQSKLLLIIGHNLVVVPYVQENRKLSSLMGSNVQQFDIQQREVLPESEIYKNLLPALLEKDDVESISKIIASKCDIPDTALIDILFWSLQHESRKQLLLDILYNYTVNNVHKLRSVFNINTALQLLDYITINLNDSNSNLKLIKWMSLFIDAFYSQLIVSSDAAIENRLQSYREILKKECEYLNDYRNLEIAMSCVKRKKIILV